MIRKILDENTDMFVGPIHHQSICTRLILTPKWVLNNSVAFHCQFSIHVIFIQKAVVILNYISEPFSQETFLPQIRIIFEYQEKGNNPGLRW